MGDILPPKRQTVVDRLRRRIEHYRRHQGACVPRYEQTLDGLLGQHAQDTFLLRQRFLESKAKKSTKKSAANSDHTPKTPTSNAASLQSSKYKRAHVDRLGSPIAPAKIGVPDEDLAPQQPSHPTPARTPQQQQQQQQQPTAIPMDQSPSAGNPSGLTQLSVEIVQQFSSSSGPQIQTNVTVTTMAGSGLKTSSIGSPATSVGQDIKNNHQTSNERDLQDKMSNGTGTGGGVSCKQEPEQGGLEECGRAQNAELPDGFEATMNGTGSFVDPVPFISQFVLMEDSSDGIINSDAFNDLMANLSPDLITEFEKFGENVDAVAATIKPHDTEDGHKDPSSEGQKMTDGTGSRDSSSLEDPSGLLSASVVLQCSNGGYQVGGGKQQVSPLNFCGPQNPVQVPRRLPAAETLMHMASQHQNMKQKQHQQHHHHQQQQTQQQQQLQHQHQAPQQQQPQQNSHLGMGLHARTPYGSQAPPSASEYHSMPEALPQFRAAAATAMDFVNAASSNQSFMGKGPSVSAAGGGTHSTSMFPFVTPAQQQQQHHHHHHHHHHQQHQQHQHHLHQQQHVQHHHQQQQHQHHHRHHVQQQQQVTFAGSLGTQGSATGSATTPQNAPQPFGAVKARFGESGTDCSSPVAVHVHTSSSSPGAQYIHPSASATAQNQIHHQQQQQQQHHQLHQQHYMNSHQLQVSQMQQQQQAAQSGQQQLQQTSQGQQMRIGGDGGKMVVKTNQSNQLQQQQQQQLQQRNAAFNQQHQTPVSSTDHYHMTVVRSQSAIFGQPQPTATRMTSSNGGNVPMHFTAKMEPTGGGHDTMQQVALRQQMYHHHQQQQQQQQQQRQPVQICAIPRPPPPQYMVQHQMANTQQQQEQTMVTGFPMNTSTPGGRPPTQAQLQVVVDGRGAKSANSYTRDQRAPNVVLSHGGHEWRPMHSQARFVGPTSLVNVADGSACAVQGQMSSQHQRLFPAGNVGGVHGRIRPSRMPVATNADMNHNMMQSVGGTLQNASAQMSNNLQMVPSLQMNVMSDLLDGSADGFLPSGGVGTDFNLDFLDSMVTGGNGGGSGGANGGASGTGGASFNASDANDLLCSLDSGTTYSILEGL